MRIVLKTKHQKDRTCLRCGKVFFSSWAGHRICPRCANRKEPFGGLVEPRRLVAKQ